MADELYMRTRHDLPPLCTIHYVQLLCHGGTTTEQLLTLHKTSCSSVPAPQL